MDNDTKLLSERYRVIKEGMDFYPTKSDPERPNYHTFVFPPSWTDPYHGMSNDEITKKMYSDEEFKPHQDYRGDLDIHLSNSNAIDVIKALEPYIHLQSKQLKIPVKLNHNDYSYSIPLDIFIAACKSYLGNVLAKPEPVIPTYTEPRQTRKTADIIDFKTGEVTPGSEEPIGPTIIHGGRPENYIKTKVMQILKIAIEGKSMGGEFMSIG